MSAARRKRKGRSQPGMSEGSVSQANVAQQDIQAQTESAAPAPAAEKQEEIQQEVSASPAPVAIEVPIVNATPAPAVEKNDKEQKSDAAKAEKKQTEAKADAAAASGAEKKTSETVATPVAQVASPKALEPAEEKKQELVIKLVIQLPKNNIAMAYLEVYLKIKRIIKNCDIQDIKSDISKIEFIISAMKACAEAKTLSDWIFIIDALFQKACEELIIINQTNATAGGLGGMFRDGFYYLTSQVEDLFFQVLLATINYCSHVIAQRDKDISELKEGTLAHKLREIEFVTLKHIESLESEIIKDITNLRDVTLKIAERNSLLIGLVELNEPEAAAKLKNVIIPIDPAKMAPLLPEYAIKKPDINPRLPIFCQPNFNVYFFREIIPATEKTPRNENDLADFERTDRIPCIPIIFGLTCVSLLKDKARFGSSPLVKIMVAHNLIQDPQAQQAAAALSVSAAALLQISQRQNLLKARRAETAKLEHSVNSLALIRPV